MPKLDDKALLDMMLGDKRIQSWVRTEYRNMRQTAPEKQATTGPDKKADPAKAE